MSSNLITLEYGIIQNDFSRAGEASSSMKKILNHIGIYPSIVRKAAIVTYEAEMNIVIHSFGGKILVSVSPQLIEIVAIDTGPGIDNIDLAMQEGYSTAPNDIRELGFGAGMGLPNMKKYCDEFSISSIVGKETKVIMKISIK